MGEQSSRGAGDRLRFAAIGRIASISLLLVIVSLLFSCTAEKTDVAFFYEELCPSCDSYKRAKRIVGRLLTLAYEHRGVKVETHNLIDPEGAARLTEEIDARGFPDISRSVPLLFVDDEYYVGYREIETVVSGFFSTE